MEKILIFGHKNPDTDTTCSAVAMANMQAKLGKKVEARVLGELNKETKYAFNYFNIEEPKLLEEVEEGQQVILVDHNEFSQSVKGIEKAKIEMVVDHHRIANFETAEPLFYMSKPVGCTCTVLFDLYKMYNLEIDEKTAALMLSAIISDTLLFKSPTCTKADVDVAEELAKIAHVDIEKYGLDMLKAGTDLDDLSAEELISLDAKDFEKDGVKFTIAQVNTVNIDDVLKRQVGIELVMQKYINDKNIDLFVFVITDILNSNSEIIALGNRTDIVEKSYKLENNTAFLEGMVSRKKQILPFINNNI